MTEADFGEPPLGFSIAANSSRMLVWDHGPAGVVSTVVDLASGEPVGPGGGPGLLSGALTPDGRTVVRRERNQTVSNDVNSGAAVARLGPLQALAVSPAGVMIGATEDGLLVRYDPRSLTPLGRPLDVTRGEVSELVFDGSGDLLALRRPTGTATIVDVQTGTQVGQPVPGKVVHVGGGHISLRNGGDLLSVPVEGGTSMWALSPELWVEAACRLAGRELTQAERDRHLAGEGIRDCRSAAAS